MDTLAKRLRFLRKERGLSQEELAELSGVEQSLLSKLERGVIQRTTGLVALANALRCRPTWLDSGDGPMDAPVEETTTYLLSKGVAYGQPVAVFDEGDVLSDSYIQIKEFEIQFSAGNGRTPIFEELTDSVAATYRREWFQRMKINPARAIRVKVSGNSMEPFLFDGDTVLVNLAETNIINGKVFALRYGEELRIKRVYRKLDGGLILHSDNEHFLPRDEEVPPSVVDSSISIVGRVRDKSGSGGL